jgi:sugar lactone lactonase YvrE
MQTAKLLSALCLLCLSASISRAQTIITVAGNGTSGYSGDGGPATSAQLFGPKGVAVDPAGNIYIADDANNCVRKVSIGNGFITPFAGMCGSIGAYGGDGLPATQANLNSPFNVSLDALGNLYISDSSNHVVRKVNTSGIITTVAGNGSPCGNGTCGDGGQATSATLYYPRGLAVDTAGNIYIGVVGGIRKVGTSGIINTIAGDPNHNIIVTGNINEGDGGQAHSSFLGSPQALALDPSGLYIADNYDQVVRKISTCAGQITGTCLISRIAGNYGLNGSSGDGGPATSAKLDLPSGLAMDITNNQLYVSDKNSRRVRVINSAAKINAFAGTGSPGYTGDNGPATLAKLADTWQLAVDSCGNVYIADSTASVIRKVLAPNCSKGMTWSLLSVNVPTGTIRVGCGNACDAYHGDTLCTTPLPLLCIKKSGTGFPLPLPATVNNTSLYSKWSGGIVGTTAPIIPPTTITAADAMCTTQFGVDWRVAEFHDGWGWAFQAYGGVGSASQRFWVHINSSPGATCWH